jgi:hypothetical protein
VLEEQEIHHPQVIQQMGQILFFQLLHLLVVEKEIIKMRMVHLEGQVVEVQELA